jgi:hypothetical protein
MVGVVVGPLGSQGGGVDRWGLRCVAIKPSRPMQFLFVFSLLNLSRG